MDIPLDATKPCEFCEEEIRRADSRSDYAYTNQRWCTRECAQKAKRINNKNRVKKEKRKVYKIVTCDCGCGFRAKENWDGWLYDVPNDKYFRNQECADRHWGIKRPA